jgi:hypothetical protein
MLSDRITKKRHEDKNFMSIYWLKNIYPEKEAAIAALIYKIKS